MTLFRRMRGNKQQQTGRKQEPSERVHSRRPYLEGTAYILPKDPKEEERMRFQHEILKAKFGLYNVRLSETANILDVGSGAGMWSRDIAHALPLAQVYAIDLETPKITGHLEPNNYHYLQADILKPFPFHGNSFEYVYQRLLVAAIPTTMWSFLFLEEMRTLKYGGWLEVLEVADVCINAGPIMQKFMHWLRLSCETKEIFLPAVKGIGTTLKSVGFQHITCQEVSMPIGEWGGVLGKNFSINMLHIFRALKDLYVKNGVNPEEFESTLYLLPNEWTLYKTSYIYYHITAQKASAL